MIVENDIIEAYLAEPDVHEVRSAGMVGAGLSLFVALIAVIVHGFNAYLMFWTGTPLFLTLLIHFAASFLVILFAIGLRKIGRDTRFMMLLGITTTTMGIFGAMGTLISILMHFWHMRLAHSFGEWFATIFPRFERNRAEIIYDDIMFGRDENPLSYNVISFLDIMEIGSENQKREAISRMTERFDASFAPAFNKALNDRSNTIRVQAATAVAKIEKQFMHRLMRITEAASLHPDDIEIKLILAEHYDDYAFTGILDNERERINRRRALKHYQEYLKEKPDNLSVVIKVGRILLREDRAVEASEWFRDSIKKGETSDALVMWYLEALYASGKYDELRQKSKSFVTKLEEYEDMRPQLVESVKMWAGEIAPTTISEGVS